MTIPNPWTFDPDQNRLLSETTSIGLTPKTAAMLRILIRHKGDVLSPERFLGEVWKDVHVTSDLVREYISDIRRALGDDARDPSYIETVRGKGFRLIGPVTLAAETHQAGRPLPRIRVARPNSFGGDASWQAFVDQMGEEVILNLARFSDLAVIARDTSYAMVQPPQRASLGPQGEADYTLDLRAYADPTSNKIYAKLVADEEMRVLWTCRFDLSDDDLPAIPSDIAAQVANALASMNGAILRNVASLGLWREAASFDAFRLYALACECEHSFGSGQEEKARAYIEKSIELDPDFARSHLIKGYLYAHSVYRGPEHSPADWHAMAQEAFEQAYALDSNDPMILATMALGKSSAGELAVARFLAHKAIDRSWNCADAAVISSAAATLILGDTETAEALLDTAKSLNPNTPGWYGFYEARNAFFAKDYRGSIAHASACTPFLTAFVFRLLSEVSLNDTDAAFATQKALFQAFPSFTFDTYSVQIGLTHPGLLDQYKDASQAVSVMSRV